MVKNLPDNSGDVRDMGLFPGLGRHPGEGSGCSLAVSHWVCSLPNPG